jgi:hypothetical protein
MAELLTPENIQVKGTCDTAVVLLGSFIQLAHVYKKNECEVDVRFTEFVKSTAEVNDTVVSVCGEAGVLYANRSHGITFLTLPAGGLRISVPYSGQATWAILEIRDARGRLLFKNRQGFKGQTRLVLEWRPGNAPRGIRFFAVTLGRGRAAMEKSIRAAF